MIQRTLCRRRGLSQLLLLALVLSQSCPGQTDSRAVAQSEQSQPKTLTDAERTARLKERDQTWEAAQAARDKGDLVAAIRGAEAVVAIEREVFGDPHAELIGTLSFLAKCHEMREDFRAARTMRADVLIRVTQAYGPDDYRVVDAKLAVKHVADLESLTPDQRKELAEAQDANGRVLSLYAKGQFGRAVKLAERVLETHRTLLGENHPSTATGLDNLAELLHAQGNNAAAEPLYQQGLKIYENTLGMDHPNTAMSLNNLAKLYDEQGKYAAAEPLYQRALKIREKALGPEHPDTATSLNNLASLHQEQGNYPAAEPLYQRALKIDERALGPDHQGTATDLNNLAGLYKAQGNYAAAEPLYQRALTIREKVFGPNHAETATSLSSLAELYRAQANYAAAEPLCLRALKIREKVLGSEHPSTAKSLNNLGLLYKSQGDFAAAEPLLQRALKIREKKLGRDHPDTATSLNNLALLCCSQGNYVAAEGLYQRALKIREKSLGSEHPGTATSLNNLALLYEEQGKYASAEPLYQRALKIREKALDPDHPDTALSLNNLATLYKLQGNYGAAEPLFQRALKIHEQALGRDHPNTATSLDNLAAVYVAQEDYATAEPLCQRALKIKEIALGPSHFSTAISLNNLAQLYRLQGKFADAEPLCQRTREIFETALGPNHPSTATSLNNLAVLYESQRNFTAAERAYERTLKIRETMLGPDHPAIAASLGNLARFQWYRDRPDAAAPYAERALGIQLRHLDATAAVQTEQQQFLMSRNVGIDVSVWLTVSGADARLTAVVYRDVLAWKGLITARQQGLRLALKDDPLFKEFQRVTQNLSTVSLNPPLPPSDPQALAAWKTSEPELRRTWESQKATLEADHERLEKKLAVKSIEFRESLEQRRVQPADLVAALKAQDRPTALIDVLEYPYDPRKDKDEKDEQRIVAFVVRGDQPVVRVELGAADAIARQVGQWRDSILRKGNGRDFGEELRKGVWLPLEAHLDGIETVLLSPDGVLGLLPFEALPGKADGTRLIEDYRLAFVPVPQLIPGLLARPGSSLAGQRLLLVGDVDYGTNANGEPTPWKPLRGTAEELTTLSALYGSRFPTDDGLSALRGAAATEREVAQQMAQFPVLHFATHGLFEQTEQRVIPSSQTYGGTRGPEMLASAIGGGSQTVKVTRSGLVLAGANRRPVVGPDGADPQIIEDGLLMDNEILAMPLKDALLVVMSACDTAQGTQQSGEGLLGIQRAFQVAGARTTVASLWPIDDAATVLLMQRFYENLWSGKMSRLDALRDAQLWMLRSGKQALRESAHRAIVRGQNPRGLKLLLDDLDELQGDRLPPFYWAAFELSGDWR